MPSKDPINEKANEWMRSAGIPVAQGPQAHRPKEQKPKRQMAAQLLKLARRLGRDPDELAKSIPADTIRRLKYPVKEHVTPDGKRVFEHDLGIEDAPHSRL